jgi:hypothetical protein
LDDWDEDRQQKLKGLNQGKAMALALSITPRLAVINYVVEKKFFSYEYNMTTGTVVCDE